MAMDSIFSHKFRSFLTILGIVVGVMTAIVVASILTGMRQSIVSIVEEYGTNNIYAYHLSTGFGPRSRDERNRKPLTDEDATAILNQSTAVQDITCVAPNIGSFGGAFDDNLVYEGKNYRWALTDGVQPNYAEMTNLVIKQGRFGEFTACTNYPSCKFVKQKSTGVLCPKDGGDIVERKSRRGKVFYGCANYPDCDFTLWNKPVAEKCPECGAPFLVEKITKRHGRQLVCNNEDCSYVRQAEELTTA